MKEASQDPAVQVPRRGNRPGPLAAGPGEWEADVVPGQSGSAAPAEAPWGELEPHVRRAIALAELSLLAAEG